ncbi:hypothetical protein ABKN59_009327 [Abortiporus biennis]
MLTIHRAACCILRNSTAIQIVIINTLAGRITDSRISLRDSRTQKMFYWLQIGTESPGSNQNIIHVPRGYDREYTPTIVTQPLRSADGITGPMIAEIHYYSINLIPQIGIYRRRKEGYQPSSSVVFTTNTVKSPSQFKRYLRT